MNTHRVTSRLHLAAFVGACAACAACTAAAEPPDRPAFRSFRYDDDFTPLRDPALRTQPLDALKYIPLGEAENEGDFVPYVCIGGEARTRYDYFKNPGFGLRGLEHDDYVIQRFLLSSDLHLTDRFRVFSQIVSGFQLGEESVPSPQQDDVLDLQQAFADYRFGEAEDLNLTLRAGRMEMGFGSYRLVSPRDPTNVRLNFDGARATLAWEGVRIDAFLTRPVEQERGVFNDGENDNQTFWGLYSTLPLTPSRSLNADFYYLGLRRELARFSSGVGTDDRHSIGTRMWGKSQGFDYDVEAVFQFGTFAQTDILAWTVASNLGYSWQNAAWKPRLGVKADVASGDTNPNDNTTGTFYALFPRQGYFSELNLLAPANFFDVHPIVQFSPVDALTVSASWDPFWRFSADDAVYGPGRIAIPAAASDSLYVGSTFDLQVEWAVSRQLTVTGYYGHFFKGDVVQDAGGKDVDYVGAWITFKF